MHGRSYQRQRPLNMLNSITLKIAVRCSFANTWKLTRPNFQNCQDRGIATKRNSNIHTQMPKKTLAARVQPRTP